MEGVDKLVFGGMNAKYMRFSIGVDIFHESKSVVGEDGDG